MKPNIAEIKKKICPVLQRYDVARAAIFGSLVRGEMKKGSDVDILIKFKGRKSLLDLARLKIELERILNKDVDVLTYNSLHPFIKKQILSEQKIIL